MAKAKELGIEVKTHMSSIEENEINKIIYLTEAVNAASLSCYLPVLLLALPGG